MGKRMRQPPRSRPRSLKPLKKAPISDPLYPAADLGLPSSPRQLDVIEGSKQATQWLDTFLSGRGLRYSREMSSPVPAYGSCSRLSPYLAHGCLSIRSVAQARTKRPNQSHPKRIDSLLLGTAPLALSLHAKTRKRTPNRVPLFSPSLR